MLHEQFKHQNVAIIIGTERFDVKNVSNTIKMAVSRSKLLQQTMNTDGEEKQPLNISNQVRTQGKTQRLPSHFADRNDYYCDCPDCDDEADNKDILGECGRCGGCPTRCGDSFPCDNVVLGKIEAPAVLPNDNTCFNVSCCIIPLPDMFSVCMLRSFLYRLYLHVLEYCAHWKITSKKDRNGEDHRIQHFCFSFLLYTCPIEFLFGWFLAAGLVSWWVPVPAWRPGLRWRWPRSRCLIHVPVGLGHPGQICQWPFSLASFILWKCLIFVGFCWQPCSF